MVSPISLIHEFDSTGGEVLKYQNIETSLLRGDIWIRDPNIQFYNGTYYMTGTCCGDGITIFSSTDLENWDSGTLAYAKNDSNPWIDANFWAPEMHVREDVNGTATFYLYFSGIKDGKPRRTGCAIASDPLGPYVDFGPMINDSGIMKVDALTPTGMNCLDGTLFFDPRSGKEYFIYSYEWINDGTGQMWIQEMAANYSMLLGDPVSLWSGGDAQWSNAVIDGPFVWYYNNLYYMLWSSFHESSGNYTTGYAHADDLMGPWVQEEWPVITTHGGHASLFLVNESWDKIGDVNTDIDAGDLRISFHQPNSGGDPHCIIARFYYENGRWRTDPSYLEGNWTTAADRLVLIPIFGGIYAVIMVIAIVFYLKSKRKKRKI